MSDTLVGGAGGAAAPAWIADLPEDLRSSPSLQSFKGNDWKEVGPQIAKSFIETKKLTGQKAYDLPKEDWKPEQWKEWHKAIGVPESPDKYDAYDGELLKKTGLPPEVMAAANQKFHELGLTPKQVKGLIHEWYLPDVAKGMEAQAAEKEAALKRDEDAIRQEFGADFDKNMGLLKMAMKQFGNEDVIKWANESGAGNHPGLVKMLVNIGKHMTESSARSGGDGGAGGSGNADSAKKEIEDMMQKRISDPAFAKAFENPKSPEYQRWIALHDQAYPKA